jgi:hypothetical protein
MEREVLMNNLCQWQSTMKSKIKILPPISKRKKKCLVAGVSWDILPQSGVKEYWHFTGSRSISSGYTYSNRLHSITPQETATFAVTVTTPQSCKKKMPTPPLAPTPPFRTEYAPTKFGFMYTTVHHIMTPQIKHTELKNHNTLTLSLLTWKKWWAPSNATNLNPFVGSGKHASHLKLFPRTREAPFPLLTCNAI